MKIATIVLDNREVSSIFTDHGFLPISRINQQFNKDRPNDLFQTNHPDCYQRKGAC